MRQISALGTTFLWEGSYGFVDKKMDEKQTNSMSCLQFLMKKIQRYEVSVKFPLKFAKFQILRIHEDYVTTTIFTLMLLHGLLVLLAPKKK